MDISFLESLLNQKKMTVLDKNFLPGTKKESKSEIKLGPFFTQL